MYGLQIWGTAKRTHIEKIQRQQSKILRIISKSDRHTTNNEIHSKLNMTTINEELKKITKHFDKLQNHNNTELNTLLTLERNTTRRLKRSRPSDLIR